MYNCVECNDLKGKDGFYNKQWKLKGNGSLCKICWDQKMVLQSRSSSKKNNNDTNSNSSNNNNNNNNPVVVTERKVIAVKERKLVAVKAKRKSTSSEDVDIIYNGNNDNNHNKKLKQDEQQKTFNKESELPPPTTTNNNNAKFIGTYKLLRYSSGRACKDIDYDSDDDGCVESTKATYGFLEIKEKEWNGKPALYGKYAVYDLPLGDDEEDHDEHVHGEMIEHVHPDTFNPWVLGNGFNILACNDGSSKDFIIDRDGHYEDQTDSNWWEDFNEDYESGFVDAWCGGKLRVNKGNNSKKEEDDYDQQNPQQPIELVLDIEESKECEWDITMVFQKIKVVVDDDDDDDDNEVPPPRRSKRRRTTSSVASALDPHGTAGASDNNDNASDEEFEFEG